MEEHPGQEHSPVDRDTLIGAMYGVRSRGDFVGAAKTAERYLDRHPHDAET